MRGKPQTSTGPRYREAYEPPSNMKKQEVIAPGMSQHVFWYKKNFGFCANCRLGKCEKITFINPLTIYKISPFCNMSK